MGPTNAKTNYENKCEKMRHRTYFYVGKVILETLQNLHMLLKYH